MVIINTVTENFVLYEADYERDHGLLLLFLVMFVVIVYMIKISHLEDIVGNVLLVTIRKKIIDIVSKIVYIDMVNLENLLYKQHKLFLQEGMVWDLDSISFLQIENRINYTFLFLKTAQLENIGIVFIHEQPIFDKNWRENMIGICIRRKVKA